MKTRFDHKQAKHGPGDRPLIFDLSGDVEPRSRSFMKSAMALNPSQLRLYYLRVAAAIARLIGKLDQRTHWARATQAGATPEVALDPDDDPDDTTAWETHLTELRLDHALDDTSHLYDDPGDGNVTGNL